MIDIADKSNCCGCTACASVCPQGCIAMREDAEGFLYPEADKDACVDCGLCERVCPLLHKPARHEVFAVYGAKNKNDDVRLTSSSGGMFTLFAQAALADNGAVFGAAQDDGLTVRHVQAETAEELLSLRGSKYVQSVTAGCFAQARALLRAGRTVLFSGTPCQIAGLKGYLAKPYDNLLTIDVVCHGVPSPRVYRKHLRELAAQAGEPVTQVRFRDKTKGWKNGETLFLTEHCRMGASKRRETYMRLFLNNVSIRPSCAQCAFNNQRSLADITIADYWGVDKQFPQFDDDKGVTLVIVNTAKGAELLRRVRQDSELLATDFAKGAEYNLAVAKSLPLHPQREFFFANLEKYTLTELAAKLLP